MRKNYGVIKLIMALLLVFSINSVKAQATITEDFQGKSLYSPGAGVREGSNAAVPGGIMPMMLVTALALKTGLCHSGLCSKLAGLNLGCSRRGFGAKGTGQDLDILQLQTSQ